MLKIYESRPVGLKCPYCGIKNVIRAAGLENGANLIICDPAEGGCDRYFFAKVSIKVVIDEIQPIGPSQFNTCRNCIHWDEAHEMINGNHVGNCTGPEMHIIDMYGEDGRPETALVVPDTHSCNGWEPAE